MRKDKSTDKVGVEKSMKCVNTGGWEIVRGHRQIIHIAPPQIHTPDSSLSPSHVSFPLS